MKVATNRIGDIVKHYVELLLEVFNEQEAKFHLYWLIEHYVGVKAQFIPMQLDDRVNESELLNIHFGVKDLLKQKPIQHIVGAVEFMEVNLHVNEHVLIPRPETEEMVSLILQSNIEAKNALDIGTGSGAIAISLAKALDTTKVTAIEFSKEALITALGNAHTNKAKVSFLHLDFLDSSQWSCLDFNFDLIVSNPPYVRHQEKIRMDARVLDFEPHQALFVEDDNPLIFYKAIADFAAKQLSEDGHIWMEINEYLAEETAALFKKQFRVIEIINDFRERPRFIHVVGRKMQP